LLAARALFESNFFAIRVRSSAPILGNKKQEQNSEGPSPMRPRSLRFLRCRLPVHRGRLAAVVVCGSSQNFVSAGLTFAPLRRRRLALQDLLARICRLSLK